MGRCGRLVVAVLALVLLARLILAAGHFARLAIFNMAAQQCRVGRRVKVEGEAEDYGEVSFERKLLSNRTWRALELTLHGQKAQASGLSTGAKTRARKSFTGRQHRLEG